jgi:hypothetical protein
MWTEDEQNGNERELGSEVRSDDSALDWEIRVIAVALVWGLLGSLFGLIVGVVVNIDPSVGIGSGILGGLVGAIAGGTLEAGHWND